jgi:hypothetical protein
MQQRILFSHFPSIFYGFNQNKRRNCKSNSAKWNNDLWGAPVDIDFTNKELKTSFVPFRNKDADEFLKVDIIFCAMLNFSCNTQHCPNFC